MVLARRPLLILTLLAALAAALFFGLSHRSAPAQAAAASKTYSVSIKDFAFHKAKLTIKVGDKVKWTNKDDMEHNAHSDQSGGPKGKLLAKGKSYTWTAKKKGTFKYHCEPHPFMKGTITVK